MSELEIFAGALEKTDPAGRCAFLDQTCGDDEALRRRVEELLRAHARAKVAIQLPAVEEVSAEHAETNDGTVKVQHSARRGRVGMSAKDRLPPALSSAGSLAEEESPLTFLGPSSKPGSIGRLGQYEVLAILGQGGFGTVLKAFDDVLHRVVAIKVMSARTAAISLNRQRFLREARAGAAIRHENAVQIYGVQEQPIPYLVMEYIAGGTLHQHLDEIGPLDLPEVLRLGQQIASGLAAAHAQGLIHRDIKPANILLETGMETKAKITDFGMARAVDEATLTQSGIICGTPNFMSPEQALGATIDQRADLFSLGSVLYVMVGGRLPFWASTPLRVMQRVADDTPRPIQEIIPEVPTWLCDLIAKLHAKKPEDRFQTAQEVADLLGRALAELREQGTVDSLPGITPAQSPVPMSDTISLSRPGFARKRRWMTAAALCLLLPLAGLGLSEATGITDLRENVSGLFSPADTPVAPSNGSAQPDQRDPSHSRPNPDPATPSVDWLQQKAGWLGHKGPVLAAAMDANGKFLATSGADRTIRVWEPGMGTLLKAFDFRFGEPAAVTFSADGKFLVGGGTDYGLMAWETNDWMEGFAAPNHEGWSIRCLAPHGNFILSTGKANGAYHYYRLDGKMIAGRRLSASEAWSIAMRADGKRTAIGLGDGNIDFYVEGKGKGDPPQRHTLSGHKLAVRAVAFSSDAGLLISGGADKMIRFWSSNDGTEVGKAAGHDGAVLTLALSPTGKHLISGGADGTLRLWNTESFKQVSTPLTLPAPVNAVVWSADGQTLATATRDGSVQLWRILLPH